MTLEGINASWARRVREQRSDPALRLVMGEGQSVSPVLLWIGEAPGEQEERELRPFVGKAGANLQASLNLLQVAREAVYITNAVKLRPTAQGSSGRLRNRPPTPKEVQLFLPWLEAEIACVGPQHIITLGNTPLQALLGRDATVGALHGTWQAWRGFRLYPMYHPAAIIYRRELTDTFRADTRALANYLSMLYNKNC